MKEAQALIMRIRRRQLYKCSGFILLSPETVKNAVEICKGRSTPPATLNPVDPTDDRKEFEEFTPSKKYTSKDTPHSIKINFKEAELDWGDRIFDLIDRACEKLNISRPPRLTRDQIKVKLSLSLSLPHPKETALRVFRSNS